MISIFNGKTRNLGKGPKQDICIQVSIDLRKHLHLLKGARLGVLMCIASHSDNEGWAFPSVDTIKRETGYNEHTIYKALDELCKLILDGSRILLRHQKVNIERGYFESNRYLLFPSPEEVAKWEKKRDGPTAQNVHTGEPSASFPQSVKPHAANAQSNYNQSLNKSHVKQETVKASESVLPDIAQKRLSATQSRSQKVDSRINEIIKYWRLVMRKPTAKIPDAHIRAVALRLSRGATTQEIKLAIEGCRDSEYHQGDKDAGRLPFNDLVIICNDELKYDRFIEGRCASAGNWTVKCCNAPLDLRKEACSKCGGKCDCDDIRQRWLKDHKLEGAA